ncbi:MULTISPECIES: ABC transporter ATP-binding protein [unclassified Paenibacillus]|uniref:ABC transporter ATP-binding protein n=1 Tax=unclassified Paenibacillus TaxID=185978 RepID=UPI001AEB253F|nr:MULTISPECIES: ABC transporter ATP-binding protein [unclassified Paenibacillus]MBP1157178.1 branched-chain amino acid transport system ATP-binding protein [Paenibacillus sp. PvP091]MBP1172083.1 branched-chain amino acid transport system ATP-binding protein [Paenibacillus sp. PvR098]MBP2438464.1 branched-chain amino acid transport system ATP-binding protein [Paenibacillus sp. PvP052]
MVNKLLEIHRLTKQFGGVVAVNDVSFEVNPGEIIALIGPNGAGKTTLFNLISSVISPTSGEIRFKGERIDGKKTHELSKRGISRTFQNLQIFNHMTVLENVMLGTHIKLKTNLLSAGLRLPVVRKEDELSVKLAEEALELVGLKSYGGDIAGTLPFGLQKLLEIARAIVSEPSLILLDEPMAGLNDGESRTLALFLLELKQKGYSILFVEHDMATVMKIADRIVVIDFGKKISEGTPGEISKDPKVIAAYLGEEVF